MSDTVAVALIAVGGTLGSGLLSYIAASRNAGVQLAGVEVEMQKLGRTHSEEARQERLQVYHDFLYAVDRLEEVVSGLSDDLTKEAVFSGITSAGAAFSRLILLGNQDVVDEAEKVMGAIAAFSRCAAAAAEEDERRSFSECAEIAGEEKLDEWGEARNQMRHAMRCDLSR